MFEVFGKKSVLDKGDTLKIKTGFQSDRND